ncbi:MAG: EscU/YscU/HrcU family type III secretion system export apparatus switch protein [Deferribacteraceae bacterium]|jgi:flagellar biosynthesis protein|nr:EscU/YscU/HrcU family type III secretion system export apparatus switch protein [Deferribacteraceae bacterium]
MKRKKVAALGYDKETDKAPHLLAKGAGHVAEKILAKAAEHNIPIREDSDLVEALSKLDIHQEIPAELYRVAAEILAEVYAINKKIK